MSSSSPHQPNNNSNNNAALLQQQLQQQMNQAQQQMNQQLQQQAQQVQQQAQQIQQQAQAQQQAQIQQQAQQMQHQHQQMQQAQAQQQQIQIQQQTPASFFMALAPTPRAPLHMSQQQQSQLQQQMAQQQVQLPSMSQQQMPVIMTSPQPTQQQQTIMSMLPQQQQQQSLMAQQPQPQQTLPPQQQPQPSQLNPQQPQSQSQTPSLPRITNHGSKSSIPAPIKASTPQQSKHNKKTTTSMVATKYPAQYQARNSLGRSAGVSSGSSIQGKSTSPLKTTSCPSFSTKSLRPKNKSAPTSKSHATLPNHEPFPVLYLRTLFTRSPTGLALLQETQANATAFEKPSQDAIDAYDLTVVQAIRQANLEELQRLVTAGHSLQACNRFGESLLHMACRRGHVQVVQFLLQHGARLQARDDFGRTPLHDACWTAVPHLELMTLLLQRAAPALWLAPDVRGHSPFHYARREHWDVWVDFLKTKADDIAQILDAEAGDASVKTSSTTPNAGLSTVG